MSRKGNSTGRSEPVQKNKLAEPAPRREEYKATRNRGTRKEAAPLTSSGDTQGPNASRFDNFKNLACGGIAAIFAITISLNGFSDMWTRPPTSPITFDIQVLLFLELVVLVFRWIIATHHEMDLWADLLKNPFTKQDVYAALFGLSVFLGLLPAFPHKIFFTSGFITVYFFVNYWTQWLANDHFARALKRTRAYTTSELQDRILPSMEYFWLKRPQLARIVTMMFFSFISFSLALASEFQPQPQRMHLQWGAYLSLMLIILIGELVISRWRHILDQEIEAIRNPEE